MDKIPVHTNVDGVNFTSRHYVEMKDRDKAIAAMLKDHKNNDHFTEENPFDEKKAGEVYDQMVKDVEKADKKKESAKEIAEPLPAPLAANKEGKDTGTVK
jgi:hypothetical protein